MELNSSLAILGQSGLERRTLCIPLEVEGLISHCTVTFRDDKSDLQMPPMANGIMNQVRARQSW
jgi:hypothetical protein